MSKQKGEAEMTYNIKTGKEKYYSLNTVNTEYCVLFLDLKKAFDTVDHYILLEKLKLYGVDTLSLSWFTSYLSNRKQRTCVNGFFSNERLMSCGVPRGSILGPLLFVIYMNDLKACSLSSYARMYADDTCLTASATDPEMLQF